MFFSINTKSLNWEILNKKNQYINELPKKGGLDSLQV